MRGKRLIKRKEDLKGEGQIQTYADRGKAETKKGVQKERETEGKSESARERERDKAEPIL